MLTVMLIDDDPRLCVALQFKLGEPGYQVCAVRNGQDSLARLELHKPDLILLDPMMPDMSALEVLDYLWSDRLLSSIPVLVVTGRGHTAMQARCMELGAAGFVTRPFSLGELAKTAEEHLA